MVNVLIREKIAIVLAGWKPELSEAAADAKQTIKKKLHVVMRQFRAQGIIPAVAEIKALQNK